MSNYAVVCLDETGSMHGQEERVVTSMNEYVGHIPDDTHLTVFKFDSNHWTKFFDDTKDKWQLMTLADYNPGAATPLYDRVYDTIAHAESLAANPDDKVMIMVDTDGHNNASTEYDQEKIHALVNKKKALGWEFWFMSNAMDQKAADNLGNLGTQMGMNVMSNTHANRTTAYRAAASNTISYFAGDDKRPSIIGTAGLGDLIVNPDNKV